MTLRVPQEQCPQHPPRLCGKARLSILPTCLEGGHCSDHHTLRPSYCPPLPQSGPKDPILAFPQDQSSTWGQLHCAQPPSPPGIWGRKDSESSLRGLTIIHPFPCSTTHCCVTPARPLSLSGPVLSLSHRVRLQRGSGLIQDSALGLACC